MSSPESSDREKQDVEIQPEAATDTADNSAGQPKKPTEIGGPKGLEPTRYGDWEQKGRCIDF